MGPHLTMWMLLRPTLQQVSRRGFNEATSVDVDVT